MDIVDTGAQYKVVDTQDGRVRKIPLTPEESHAVVKSWYAPGAPPEDELTTNYRKLALDSCKNIQHLLNKHPELRGSFGNPIFEAEGVYTHDIPKELQPYYAQSLAERLTPDALDATWNKASFGA